MRLIDADAIKIKPVYMHDMCGVVMIRVEDIARILNDMPTISPESERKNGKWKGYKDDDPQWKRDDGSPIFLICSECYETVLNNGSAHWNFCPNCGAMMEVEHG